MYDELSTGCEQYKPITLGLIYYSVHFEKCMQEELYLLHYSIACRTLSLSPLYLRYQQNSRKQVLFSSKKKNIEIDFLLQ